MNPLPRYGVTASAPAPEAMGSDAFQEHLSALYALSQRNNHVFGSPVGPLYHGGRHAYLPRFVFFGPHATDESWRLAFYANFDRRDLRAGHAVLHLVERLAENSGDGYGLNLSFFPLVDAAGFFLGAPLRDLGRAHWSRSDLPEIRLLEKDARLNGYHGFIQVESVDHDDVITVRVREPAGVPLAPDVELISSADIDPFPVRFERASRDIAPAEGPLTVAEDLPAPPFELTLCVPAAWPDDLYHGAIITILNRFIIRYRALQAYGQHL